MFEDSKYTRNITRVVYSFVHLLHDSSLLDEFCKLIFHIQHN